MQDASEFRTIHQIIKKAKQNLNQNLWDYVIGGSSTETTLKRNRAAIDARALQPKVLNDVSNVDTSATVVGQKLTMPVVLAPIGSLQNIVEGGGATAAIAAATEASASGTPLWIPVSLAYSLALSRRACASFKARD